MSVVKVKGHNQLDGEIQIQGSKNAALPIMAACLLTNGITRLFHVPEIQDVYDMMAILKYLNCEVSWCDSNVLRIDTRNIENREVPLELTQRMRSSVFLLGPLLSRFGRADLSMPGGCRIGKRPIDYHLSGLRSMGAVIEETKDGVHAKAERMHGNQIHLVYPSVGATENLLMAAVQIEGVTVLYGCAREPEITDLCLFLKQQGAVIYGIGSGTLVIHGKKEICRHEILYQVSSDRIAAATYLAFAAGCGGCVTARNVFPFQLREITKQFEACGMEIMAGENFVRLKSKGKIKPVSHLETAPYPGFPTDMQSVFLALLGKAEGESRIFENVFENRFRILPELEKFGARLQADKRCVMITGVEKYYAANAEATDLRGGAALVLAGLMADGISYIGCAEHIVRGYEKIDLVLQSIGGQVEILSGSDTVS